MNIRNNRNENKVKLNFQNWQFNLKKSFLFFDFIGILLEKKKNVIN